MSTVRKITIAFIVFWFLCIGAAVLLGLNKRHINEGCYNVAMEYYNKGEYETARDLFTSVKNFRDSKTYIVECNQYLGVTCFVCPHCGEIVYFDLSCEPINDYITRIDYSDGRKTIEGE